MIPQPPKAKGPAVMKVWSPGLSQENAALAESVRPGGREGTELLQCGFVLTLPFLLPEHRFLTERTGTKAAGRCQTFVNQ